MWDVKSISGVLLASTGKKFYLNYVGCKGVYPSGVTPPKSCFTLTMWDVKFFYFVIICFINWFYLNYVGCKVFIPPCVIINIPRLP